MIMKRICIAFFIALLFNLSSKALDVITFQDEVFENILLSNKAINGNEDGFIDYGEAEAYNSEIIVDGENINNLEGIEYFTNITGLSCAGCNNLSSIDVSANIALKKLDLSNCELSVVDVSALSELSSLNVAGNSGLTQLNVKENQKLQTLRLRNTAITEIDLSGNISLTTLDIAGCTIPRLNVSKQVSLSTLDCSYNDSLKTLDVSNNLKLKVLRCANTALTRLSVTNKQQLLELDVSNNSKLSALDLTNSFNRDNASAIAISGKRCANLSCTIIDDPAWAEKVLQPKDTDFHYGFSETCVSEYYIVFKREENTSIYNIPGLSFLDYYVDGEKFEYYDFYKAMYVNIENGTHEIALDFLFYFEPVYRSLQFDVADSTVDVYLSSRDGENITYLDTKNVCGAYMFGEQLVTESGFYTRELNNNSGKQFEKQLIIVDKPSAIQEKTVSLKDGEVYLFEGKEYTAPGTYVVSSGTTDCDVTILHLNKIESTVYIITDTVCDYYTYKGKDYNSSFILTDTISKDSIVMLDITVNQSYKQTLSQMIEVGKKFPFDGKEYSAGRYDIDYIAENGCDSTITLVITVSDTSKTYVTDTVCDQYKLGDMTYLSSFYNMEIVLPSSTGEDSIAVYNITINDSYIQHKKVTIDEGTSYYFNNTQLTQSGKYAEYNISSQGCDSTIILYLAVENENQITYRYKDSSCYNYMFGGQYRAGTGTYMDTLISDIGKDSVVVLDLKMLESHIEIYNAYIHEGESYRFNDTDYSVEGEYQIIGDPEANGCDMVELDLRVLTPDDTLLTIAECEMFETPQKKYYVSEHAEEKYLTSDGRDSIVYLDITIHRNTEGGSIDTVVFEGQSLIFGGIEYKIARDTTIVNIPLDEKNQFGCDSLVVLNVRVKTGNEIERSACGSYKFNDFMFNKSGFYDVNIIEDEYGNKVDSLIILNLTIRRVDSVIFYDEIVEGEDYDFYGENISEEGIYYSPTFVNDEGCDSVRILELAVLPRKTKQIDTTVCGTLFINGEEYTSSGIIEQNLNSVSGENDSTLIINLTVLELSESVIDTTIIKGQFVNFNGERYDSTGKYYFTVENSVGCDSIVTINLTVNKELEVSEVIDTVVCDVFEYEGEMFTESGSKLFELLGNNGLKSLIEINFTINKSDTVKVFVQRKQGQIHVFQGVEYRESGTYEHTLTSITGCDSVVILNLEFFQNAIIVEDNVLSCGPCEIDGKKYKNSTTFTRKLKSFYGLDSIVKQNLTIGAFYNIRRNVLLNYGDSILLGDRYIKEEGLFNYNYPTVLGCDSTIQLRVEVNDPYVRAYRYDTVCSYSHEGIHFPNDTTITTTFQREDLKDSLDILHIAYVSYYQDTIWEIIERGDSVFFDSQYRKRSGIYSEEHETEYGCDSIVTMNLTLEGEMLIDSVFETACDNYNFNGEELTMSGIYTDTVNVEGIDVVKQLHLTIGKSYDNILVEKTIIEGESYFFGETEFFESGSHIYTFLSELGCDSIVKLELTVKPKDHKVEVSACGKYEINGSIFTESGEYIDTLKNVAGEDSIITKIITIYPEYKIATNDTIVYKDSIAYNGEYYKEEGVYLVEENESMNGCDSTISLNLFVINNSPVFDDSDYNFTIHRNSSSNSFIGYCIASDEDGHTLTYVLIDENDIFEIDKNGSLYVKNPENISQIDSKNVPITVIATDGLGADTLAIDIVIKDNVSVIDVPTVGEINVYPIMVTSNLTIEGIDENTDVAIFNTNGKNVFSIEINTAVIINVSKLAKGTYFLKLNNAENFETFMFVKL